MTSSEVVQPLAVSHRPTATRDLATAIALALGLVGPGITNAQTSSGSAIEDIVVTAEFRKTNVQDTPIAITAVNSETMDARSQVSVFEIAAQAPNVTLKPAGQAFGPSLVAFIRGIGQTDFNYALEPGVGIYIDDVYFPTLTGSLVDLLDLDRVEVLRGPQGTLAGKNSIGGSIKLFSKEPTGDGGGSISATYGSYNRIDVRASGDFAIVPDKLFARIAGVSKHRDGYVTRLDYRCMHPTSNVPTFQSGKISDCKLGTEGGQSYTAGRLALRWLVNENLEVKLSADITNDDSETQPNVLMYVKESLTTPPTAATGPFSFAGGFQGTSIRGTDGNPVYLTNAFVPYGRYRGDTVVNDPFVSYATYIDPNANGAAIPIQRFSPTAIEPISTLDDWGISMVVDWSLNERYSLKSITSYRAYDSSFAQDIDGSPINSQMLLQHLAHDQWSQELRLSGSAFDDKLDFTVGGFMFEQDGTLEANVNLYYVQFNFIHGPDTTPSHNYAGFLQSTWHFSEDFNLSAGLRYSDDEKTYTHFRRNPDGSMPQDATPTDPTTTCIGPPHNVINPTNCALFGLFNKGATWQDDRLDWRVALDYRWNDSIMTYVQVATGYKGGGVNPRPFVLAQLLPFNSEELLSYEFGFKTMLFDRRMRLNGAVFVNDYTDIILTLNPCPAVSPGPCLLPANAGDATVPGFELEMELHLTDRWMIDSSLSHLDFEYDRVQAGTVTLSDVPPFTPKWKWSAGVQYELPPTRLGTFALRVDGSYQSDVTTDALNDGFNTIEGYAVFNARLMWRSADETWDGALEVQNLSDKLYYYTLFNGLTGGGTLSGQPGMPRTFGITVRRHF